MKSILEVTNIGKKFRLQHVAGGYLSLRERMINTLKFQRKKMDDFWALSEVSFNVSQGESIGIIGRNGAGKSTMLKILSKITPPTLGRIISRGRIASLLEVGTGFHPELTGRENIFFNGSLLGMKRLEIENKFDEIVDFSGVERFLDTPLKHYSSGMQLRLAFAVAAFLEAEILIIDEVLAVGDAEFQKKCIGKMEDVSKGGRTILFVSHNMAAVESLCNRGILLDQGKLLTDGPIDEVVEAYQNLYFETFSSVWQNQKKPTSIAYIDQIELALSGEQPRYLLQISCQIGSRSRHKELFIAFDISNSRGLVICQAIPCASPFIEHSKTIQTIRTQIELPPLIPDHYKVSVWIGPHNSETICWERDAVGFEINESPIKGRSFPHSHHNGFIVLPSMIIDG